MFVALAPLLVRVVLVVFVVSALVLGCGLRVVSPLCLLGGRRLSRIRGGLCCLLAQSGGRCRSLSNRPELQMTIVTGQNCVPARTRTEMRRLPTCFTQAKHLHTALRTLATHAELEK